MRSIRAWAVVGLSLALAACQPSVGPQRDVEPQKAGVAFSAPGIVAIPLKVTEADEQRVGATMQLVQWDGARGFAVASVGRTFSSGVGFQENFDFQEVSGLFKEPSNLEYGSSERVTGNASPLWLATFRFKPEDLSCIALKRQSDELPDANILAGGRYHRQAVLAFCEKRTIPFTLDDARRIAAGFSFQP